MGKDIDDIMIQDEISDASFKRKLILGYLFKHFCIWSSIFIVLITIILFWDYIDDSVGYLLALIVSGIEGTIFYKLIKYSSKKLGVSFKTHMVKPIVQSRYQTQLYLQDDIPLERLKFANPVGNLINYNSIVGNDYFQGITSYGRRFEFTDCTLLYRLLGNSAVSFNGQILMIQMSKYYTGEPVLVSQGLPCYRTHKDYKNLPFYKTTDLKKYFKILKVKNPVTNGKFFTEENVGFCIPKANEYGLGQNVFDNGIDDENKMTIETFLTPEYINKLIQTYQTLKKSMKCYIHISVHGDMLSIAFTNSKDLFDAHFLDIFRSTDAIKARVEKECEIIDTLLELAP